jgi:hypothetical protein
MPIDPILSLFVGAVGAAVTIHVRKKHGPTNQPTGGLAGDQAPRQRVRLYYANAEVRTRVEKLSGHTVLCKTAIAVVDYPRNAS